MHANGIGHPGQEDDEIHEGAAPEEETEDESEGEGVDDDFKFYLLATLGRGERRHLKNEADLRKYIYNRIGRIILADFVLFVIQIVLGVTICILSRSNYYIVMYSIVGAAYLFSTVGFLARWNEVSTGDTRLLLSCNCFHRFFAAGLAATTNMIPFTVWFSWRHVIFILLMITYIRPAGLFSDMFSAPSNMSSCTRDPSAFYLPGEVSNYYNPAGFFRYGFPYVSDSMPLKFCPMNQTYAWPTFNATVYGYTHSPIQNADNCDLRKPPNPPTDPQHRVNGYPDTTSCEGSYPTPVLGISTPVLTGTQDPFIFVCRGNRGGGVCVNKDNVVNGPGCEPRIGRPLNICSTCVDTWRLKTGIATGPPGYEHCGTHDLRYITPYAFCAFCPGRGDGDWLSDEKYDPDTVVVVFWLSTSMVLVCLLEIFIVHILVSAMVPDLPPYIKKSLILYNRS